MQPDKKKIKPKGMSQTNSSIEVEKTERFDSDLPMEAEEREMANQSLIEDSFKKSQTTPKKIEDSRKSVKVTFSKDKTKDIFKEITNYQSW